MKLSRTIASGLLAITLATPAMSAEIFSDNFDDGNTDGWFVAQTSLNAISAVTTPDALLGSAPELRSLAGATENGATFLTYFSEVTLNNVGDTITLTFDAYHTGTSFDDTGFRFGLYDSNDTQLTANSTDNQAAALVDDDGYFVTVDIGASTTNVAAQIREETNDTSARLVNGSTFASIDNDTAPDPILFSSNTAFTYTLEIELLDAGALEFSLSNNETDATTAADDITATLASPSQGTTFDTLYFSSRETSLDLRIDNVVIDAVTTAAVPEPASLALLGVGTLLIAFKVRGR